MKNKNIHVNWSDNTLSNSMPEIKVNSEIELVSGWRSHATSIGKSLHLVSEKQIDELLKAIWNIYINEKQNTHSTSLYDAHPKKNSTCKTKLRSGLFFRHFC